MKNGILPVYKPEGISSARVVHLVKKALQVKKVGHMGTLDPFATGLLLCGIGQGTRISKFFLNGSKRYRAKIHLGIVTDTFDCTGEVVGKSDSLEMVSTENVIEVVSRFAGKQKQTPPAYSALKHKGKPLYKYAREGRKIIKPARDIEIFEILIESIDFPFIDISVLCSAGTYIRTIAYDIGEKLGCGAHLASLERSETGGFFLEHAINLKEIETMGLSITHNKIISMADALNFMPYHVADENLENKIRFGQQISVDDGLPEEEVFMRLLTKERELAAIIKYDKTADRFNYSCVFLN